ncbi:MAG: InlB B-repeat-containing protein, partial [Clostridia bacterium]
MKKRGLIYILIIVLCLMTVGIFTGCNNKSKEHTITFVSNDKVYATREMPDFFVISLPIPEIDGFIFEGWFFDKEYSNQFLATTYKDTSLNSDIVVYAKWRNENDCKITFENAENLVVDFILVKKGSKIEELPSPTKDGYEFYGWYSDSQYKQVITSDDIINGDLNLFAKWVAIGEVDKTFTITINNLGGYNLEPIKVKYGKNIEFPENYLVGYKLGGYYIDSKLTKKYVATPIVSDFELFTKWIRVDETYQIQFYSNGGNTIDSMQVRYNELLVSPNSERSGYDFAGWCLDSSCEHLYNFNTRITGDTVFYAKWVAKSIDPIPSNNFIINLELNDGQCAMNSLELEKGTYPNLPQPTKAESEFLGWFVDSDCTNKYVSKAENEDFTLYAGWKSTAENDDYVISYSPNGKECTIEKYKGSESILDIPNFINNATVVGIGDNAFINNTKIQRINMIDTVRKIGNYAFSGCANLVDMSNYKYLEEIGDYAFSGSGINTFLGGTEFRYLGSYCFAESKIRSVTIQNNIAQGQMGTNVFYMCKSLNNVSMGQMEIIPEHTFEWCSALTFINLNNCSNINIAAFKFSGLSAISIPKIKVISANAFEGCHLKELSFDDSITFGCSAFVGNSELNNITVGANFNIENGINNVMESGTFASCNNINFIVNEDNQYFSSINGNLLNKDGTVLYCVGGLTSTGIIDITEGIIQISRFALNKNNSIVTVKLPATLTEIEENALSGTYGLSKIEIAEGNSVYEIREKDDNHNGNLYKIDGNVLLRYLPTNEETEYT